MGDSPKRVKSRRRRKKREKKDWTMVITMAKLCMAHASRLGQNRDHTLFTCGSKKLPALWNFNQTSVFLISIYLFDIRKNNYKSIIITNKCFLHKHFSVMNLCSICQLTEQVLVYVRLESLTRLPGAVPHQIGLFFIEFETKLFLFWFNFWLWEGAGVGYWKSCFKLIFWSIDQFFAWIF